MKPLLVGCWLLVLAPGVFAQRIIDDFQALAAWTAQPADGVEMTLNQDVGRVGQGMRVDCMLQ